MNKKRFIFAVTLLLSLLCQAVAKEKTASTRIAFISDAHVMDVVGHPELVRSQEMQVQSTRLFNENYFALCAALDDCGRRGIKLVVLPGDLTDNGQLINQTCVRDLLNKYGKKYGMQYFVTMGNHDPARPFGYDSIIKGFLNEDGSQHSIAGVEVMDDVMYNPLMHCAGYEEQTDCYADFGFFPQKTYQFWATPFSSYNYANYSYAKAKSESAMQNRRYDLAKDTKAYDASYVVEPIKGLWILSLDGSVYLQNPNYSPEARLTPNASKYLGSEFGYNNILEHRKHLVDWVKKVTSEAKQKGKTLVTFCHYPLVDYNDGASTFIERPWSNKMFDYMRLPEEKVTDAFIEAGLQLHFAGHMHVNDTGVKQSKGNAIVNIQIPSPALYVPAYKILTVNDATHFDVETVVLDDVPDFDKFFPLYKKEYEYDLAHGKQPVWSIEALQSKTYKEFCDWHFRDLTRTRFIPKDIPQELRENIIDKNGLEILRLIASNEIGEEAMKTWTGFDMLLDLYRLRYASELALTDIPESRLRQYEYIFQAAEASTKHSKFIEQMRSLGGMFRCLLNEEPCANFSIDLNAANPVTRKASTDYTRYVDPTIGSEGVGRTFPGPSMPFGMCKPGPDCTVRPNAGWDKMPEVVTGFSQTHVSGTGGGQKYGNILIQPFLGELSAIKHEQHRKSEDIALGYYTTTYENDIRTEITTSERCAFYRMSAPENLSLSIDCGHYLGENPLIDTRESQQFVGSEVEIISPNEVRGYTRIRGGWNNGEAYTVYFCLLSDKPFVETKTWIGNQITNRQSQPDLGKRTGALVHFNTNEVNLKVGISFVSTLKARENISANDFDTQLSALKQEWNKYLSRIEIKGTEKQKRMFYTGLYHTMIMPVDRSGENPKWREAPYYDDYYAIWDTYRTSSPLLTLICPDKERDIVNSLLNIYKREGYMPDARSGNCNGRTQGGSNAEVVIADAFMKGLDGIDYNLALEAMLKDADVPPGNNEEKEGRGGLIEYNTLGYIPYGIDRAGNRTLEYAYDDFCIAEVAQGLGRTDIYERFMKQSGNWRNLWRSDYQYDEMQGFIMPRDKDGNWIDNVPWGKSKVFHPTIPYTPTTKVTPWHIPWWGCFFYEANSEEYSLSIPHDVPGLIEACGGKEKFKQRLDMFFDKSYYNVGNEPSFLSPCLYHWIGRPELSSARIHQIIRDCYDDTPTGIPGNDDSGAMSSWLDFHMMGLYPNAGQNQYIVNAPLISEYTIHLSNGRDLHVVADAKGFDKLFLTHEELMQGGTLHLPAASTISVAPQPKGERKVAEMQSHKIDDEVANRLKNDNRHAMSFTLNAQFRTWLFAYTATDDGIAVRCQDAFYLIPQSVIDNADHFCWDSPQRSGMVYKADGTFGFISKKALATLKRDGMFVYDGITWRKVSADDNSILVQADIDCTLMRISTKNELPIILEMKNNPLGIDWKFISSEE